MNLFNQDLASDVLNKIKIDKAVKDSGKYIGIPFPFPRLREHIPVIEKGHSIGFLAGTGVGKSRATRFMFLYNVVEFVFKNNYNALIYYFPLEDTKEKVFLNIFAHYLKVNFNISISTQTLSSKGDRSVPSNVIEAIGSMSDFFKKLSSILVIIDHIAHPKEIANLLVNEAKEQGTITYTSYTTQDGRNLKAPVKYTPSNDVHRIAIIDNLYNFEAEKGEDERELMINFCKVQVRKWLCNFFGYTVVQVMQMSFDKERQQFTNTGASVVSKLEPGLDGIGEAKVIARSMHLIFGLFDPSRYELMTYPGPEGYRIDILQNKFRALKILKSNDSDVGMRIGLKFDAVGEVLEELPLPKEKEAMQRVYDEIKGIKFL